MAVKLGVNIDHVATLRQARREAFPDPIQAAQAAERGGADGIVVHLREDRRHIQDKDVFSLKEIIKTKLDLEMAATREMLQIALKIKPALVTLVPEKRKELTTEGGLDVATQFDHLEPFIHALEDKGIRVSLFVDPDLRQIQASAKSGASFIEIHTGAYSRVKSSQDREARLKEIEASAKLACECGLRINAGHGLDYENVAPIVNLPRIEELNIGFSIITRSVFVGLEHAVREMKEAIRRGEEKEEEKPEERLEHAIELDLEPLLKEVLALPPEAQHHIMSVMEKVMIERAMEELKGNQVKVAKLLGISRNTLRKRLEKYSLKTV